MKLHSDLISLAHIRQAAREANVEVLFLEPVGSRKRRHGFNVYLSGSSRYATQFDRTSKAATWDEWGVFLAKLFETDCRMIANQYNGRAEFLKQTRAEVERIAKYRPDMLKKSSGPWLFPLAGESRQDFERAVGRAS